MKQIEKIERKFAILAVVYFWMVASFCSITHVLAFSYAAEVRGTSDAVGGELFVVSTIVVVEYFIFRNLIMPYFGRKIDMFRTAYYVAKNSKVQCSVLIVDSASIDKIYGQYFTDGKGHVSFKGVVKC